MKRQLVISPYNLSSFDRKIVFSASKTKETKSDNCNYNTLNKILISTSMQCTSRFCHRVKVSLMLCGNCHFTGFGKVEQSEQARTAFVLEHLTQLIGPLRSINLTDRLYLVRLNRFFINVAAKNGIEGDFGSNTYLHISQTKCASKNKSSRRRYCYVSISCCCLSRLN